MQHIALLSICGFLLVGHLDHASAQKLQRARQPATQTAPTKTVSQAPAFCSVLATGSPSKGLTVVVEENYEGAIPVRSTIKAVVERMLGTTGFNIGPGSPVRLRIKVNGSALGGTYSGIAGSCYNGARVWGELWVEGIGEANFRQSFGGERRTPGSLAKGPWTVPGAETCIPRKEDAPFFSALQASDIFDDLAFFLRQQHGKDAELCYWSGALTPDTSKLIPGLPSSKAIKILAASKDVRVLDGLLQHAMFEWGLTDAIATLDAPAVEPLIKALNDHRYRGRAAEALAKIGDKRAIEPLIGVLSKSEQALWALQKLTGQDFGNSPARWRRWWSQQPRQ